MVRKMIGSIWWSIVSLVTKKAFEGDIIKVYRYRDECFSYKLQCLEKYKVPEVDSYWEQQEEYSLNDYFEKRYKAQADMIFNEYIPLFDTKPNIIDIGCAAGEWTFGISEYCNSVKGVEYSEKMVERAIEKGRAIDNVSFSCENVLSMIWDKEYDGAMILGMLMYIADEDSLVKILKQVYDNIVVGGYVVTKDTLNCEDRRTLFLQNRKNGYNAVYWSKEVYYNAFSKAGFKLVKEYVLDEVTSRRLHFIAQGAIWKKA